MRRWVQDLQKNNFLNEYEDYSLFMFKVNKNLPVFLASRSEPGDHEYVDQQGKRRGGMEPDLRSRRRMRTCRADRLKSSFLAVDASARRMKPRSKAFRLRCERSDFGVCDHFLQRKIIFLAGNVTELGRKIMSLSEKAIFLIETFVFLTSEVIFLRRKIIFLRRKFIFLREPALKHEEKSFFFVERSFFFAFFPQS